MTNRILLTPLLILTFLFAGCQNYSHYRPTANTTAARADAQICIAECRANMAGDEDYYYSCVEKHCGLVQERGHCDSKLLFCEERSELSIIKTGVLVATTTATVVYVGGTLLILSIFATACGDRQQGDPHC